MGLSKAGDLILSHKALTVHKLNKKETNLHVAVPVLSQQTGPPWTSRAASARAGTGSESHSQTLQTS